MVQAELGTAVLYVVALDTPAASASKAAWLPHHDATICSTHGSAVHHSGGTLQGKYKLPSNLPSLRFHSIAAGLALGWTVLMSELDVIWMPHAGVRKEVYRKQADITAMRHALDTTSSATQPRKPELSSMSNWPGGEKNVTVKIAQIDDLNLGFVRYTPRSFRFMKCVAVAWYGQVQPDTSLAEEQLFLAAMIRGDLFYVGYRFNLTWHVMHQHLLKVHRQQAPPRTWPRIPKKAASWPRVAACSAKKLRVAYFSHMFSACRNWVGQYKNGCNTFCNPAEAALHCNSRFCRSCSFCWHDRRQHLSTGARQLQEVAQSSLRVLHATYCGALRPHVQRLTGREPSANEVLAAENGCKQDLLNAWYAGNVTAMQLISPEWNIQRGC